MTKLSKNKNKRIATFIAIAIPSAILIYLLLMNFVLSYNTSYSYDIGGPSDATKPYLNPAERVSEIIDGEDSSYRELIGQLVYFDVPIVRGTDSLIVSVRAKYDGSGAILLGMKNDANYSYIYKPLYNSLLENLQNYNFNGKDIYQVKGDKLPVSKDEIPEGSLVYANPTFIAPVNDKGYDVHDLTINTGLRGAHTFYLYVPGKLTMKFVKQDLNWYKGEDVLNVKLYNLHGDLIANTSVSDDGIESVSKNGLADLQDGSLNVDGIETGVYRLEFSDFDGLVRMMHLNTNKIVSSRFYLSDWAGYIRNNESPSELYFKGHGLIKLATYHSGAFQQVLINDDVLAVNSVTEPTYYSLNGSYKISIPINDLIVTFPGYGSFSEDSYFEPFAYNVLALPSTRAELDSADYVISDYRPVARDGEWFVSKTSFSVGDGYVKDGKLNFAFNKPVNSSLSVDWINSEVYHEGII